MTDFSGVSTALITPFKDNAVDMDSFRSLLQFQIANGIEGLVVNGTTGESPNLNWEEVQGLFKAAKEESKGQVPVVLGTGSNSTTKTIEMTKAAKELGADGALIVTPYYNKPTQQGIIKHYEAVAESCPLPILLYNVPGRTVISQSIETIVSLSKNKNIVGIKEASGDIKKVSRLKEECSENFTLVSGDDDSCMDFMFEGGSGVISVASHILPKEFVEISHKARSKDDSFRADYVKYSAAVKLMGIESNPIPVKMALYLMGVIASPELRLPLVNLTGESTEKLKDELQGLGVVK